MRLTREFLRTFSLASDAGSINSVDGAMGYELYDLDDDPKTFNPQVMRSIRIALLVFMIVVLVGAIAILGIGIWTLEAEYGNKQVSELINAHLYKVDSYLMIIGGAAIILITVPGLCGLFKQYRCLLGLHLGLLAFMSVMLFVAGVLGYVLVSELEDKVRGKMESAIKENYGINLDRSSRNRIITDAWNDVQKSFHCCGVYGGKDSHKSWYFYQSESSWFKDGHSNGSYVPESCCKASASKLAECVGKSNVSDSYPPRAAPPVDGDPDQWGYTLYTKGCFDVLDPYMRRTGIIIGTTAIVVGVLMLIELVLCVCLYRTLPEKT